MRFIMENRKMSSARRTRDHDTIREWIEDRDGRPAIIRPDDEERGGGILKVDFRDKDDDLEEIDWDEFFEIFDDNDLVFLHQDETASGKPSRFNKFVAAEDDEDEDDD
jgi:hypothetical protein